MSATWLSHAMAPLPLNVRCFGLHREGGNAGPLTNETRATGAFLPIAAQHRPDFLSPSAAGSLDRQRQNGNPLHFVVLFFWGGSFHL
jgi:hypothetical protein